MMRESTIKKILFGVLLAFLFLPVFQSRLKLFEETPLAGVSEKKQEASFTINNWLEGTYQTATIDWTNENFGLRPTCVRVRNQVYYELCHKVHANGAIIGKEECIHDLNYIYGWLGKNFRGVKFWQNTAARFKRVQETLAKKNILMLVVQAPGKTSYFSELVPDEFGKPSELNNYSVFSSELKKQQVNVINFQEWFMKMKDTTTYPLFSKGGYHWSNYGSVLAADSLFKYLEHKTGRDMVSFKIKRVNWSDSIRDPDNDIGKTINLLIPLETTRMAYPEVEFEKPAGKWNPSLYIVSDSYFWQIYHLVTGKQVFSHVLFSYYNKSLYDSHVIPIWNAKETASTPINFKETNIMMFMVNEGNLDEFPWLFLEKVEEELGLSYDLTKRKKRIEEIQATIRANEEWLKQVKEKAIERKVPLDSMIMMDATWVWEQELKKKQE